MHDYVAAGFMVASAAFFGLGERELEPDGNQFMGFVLTFICLGFGALQSNIADKCLRDHGARSGPIPPCSTQYSYTTRIRQFSTNTSALYKRDMWCRHCVY